MCDEGGGVITSHTHTANLVGLYISPPTSLPTTHLPAPPSWLILTPRTTSSPPPYSACTYSRPHWIIHRHPKISPSCGFHIWIAYGSWRRIVSMDRYHFSARVFSVFMICRFWVYSNVKKNVAFLGWNGQRQSRKAHVGLSNLRWIILQYEYSIDIYRFFMNDP